MGIYALIFYILALTIVGSTAMAVTRRNMVHAVVYLVVSFFGSALLFYLMGAPLLAALEVIIYAGAIMVLFLFIIMMIRVGASHERMFLLSQWLPAVGIFLIYFWIIAVVTGREPASEGAMHFAVADPVIFGHFLFRRHWLSVEIISYILLVVLIGAFFLGKAVYDRQSADKEDRP